MDVEIWSDIACPWCYIGKRRFEAALAEFEHRDDVRVTWRSFELDPSAPREREGDRADASPRSTASPWSAHASSSRTWSTPRPGRASSSGLTSHAAVRRSTPIESFTSPGSMGFRAR